MPTASSDSPSLLRRSLENGRIHSAYLLSGPGSAPRDTALDFVRALVCQQAGGPCEECIDCRRSSPREPIALDGTGRGGPLLRHVGDHADLFWIERGEGSTRVTIGQVRALQSALHLQSNEGGRRAAVIADAERMNQEAQNALLRILEEPPPQTTLVLATATSAGLLATVRSRCQRVRGGGIPRCARHCRRRRRSVSRDRVALGARLCGQRSTRDRGRRIGRP